MADAGDLKSLGQIVVRTGSSPVSGTMFLANPLVGISLLLRKLMPLFVNIYYQYIIILIPILRIGNSLNTT